MTAAFKPDPLMVQAARELRAERERSKPFQFRPTSEIPPRGHDIPLDGLEGDVPPRGARPPAHDPDDMGREASLQRIHAAKPAKPAAYLSGISAKALMAMQFAPINYVVPGYLAEGLTLLAGAPKIGKSWMALGLGVAIASGRPAFGSIAVDQGDVLYLALEDNPRRLKRRLLKMGVIAPPERLTLCTEWPDLENGCLDEISAWIHAVEKPTLIVVDVLTKVRPDASGKDSAYEADYRTLTGLQMLAGQHALAIVVVHHTRKMEAEDPFDSVSGTRGLTGAADTVLVLKRDTGTPRTILYGRGRDVEEIETALEFDRDNGTWGIVGAAHEVAKTDERQIILDTIRKAANPLSAREVSDLTGKSYETIRRTITRMVHSGEIERRGQGQYTCPTGPTCPITEEGGGEGGTASASPVPPDQPSEPTGGTPGTGGTAFLDDDDFDPFDHAPATGGRP